MRVIAGRLGGRNFLSPHSHRAHPMSDKVRGALFNALGDITGLSVLDAFAGSGALGYEALSRGAARVLAIDPDQAVQRTIKRNIEALGLNSQMKLVYATANAWLSTTSEMFNIVLCDPPYDDVQPTLLIKLAERTKAGGIVVFSLPTTTNLTLPNSYQLVVEKNYGDARLLFYRKCK